MAAEALRAAAASAASLQRPQDLVGLWLTALVWLADARWSECGTAAPSNHVLALLSTLRAHVTALRVASAAALPGTKTLALLCVIMLSNSDCDVLSHFERLQMQLPVGVCLER